MVLWWWCHRSQKYHDQETYYLRYLQARFSLLSAAPQVSYLPHSYRIGLLGFAASNMIRDDNSGAGDEGCGNYGQIIWFFFLFFSLSRAQVSEINVQLWNGYKPTSPLLAEIPTMLHSLVVDPELLISSAIFFQDRMPPLPFRQLAFNPNHLANTVFSLVPLSNPLFSNPSFRMFPVQVGCFHEWCHLSKSAPSRSSEE